MKRKIKSRRSSHINLPDLKEIDPSGETVKTATPKKVITAKITVFIFGLVLVSAHTIKGTITTLVAVMNALFETVVILCPIVWEKKAKKRITPAIPPRIHSFFVISF